MEDRHEGSPAVTLAASIVHGLTPLSAAFRFVEPTWRNYIKYVDMESREGNLAAQGYLRIWQALPPSERAVHTPEQLCDLATVPAWDLASWVTRQAYKEGEARSSLCMSFMRDRVLAKTAEFAMESSENLGHARLFAQMSGQIQTGPSRAPGRPITINNTPIASSGSVAGVRSESAPVPASGLRGMDDEIVELSRIMQSDESVVAFTGHGVKDETEDEDGEDDDE